MKRRLFLAVTIIVTLALTACVPLPQAPAPASGAGSLEGTAWVLTQYGPAAGPLTPPPGAAPTLTIADGGQVSGKAGCNNYFGALTVDGDKPAFGPLGRTLMACEDEVMALEDAYLAALDAAEGFTLADGQLIIRYQGGGSALVFAPAQASSYQGPDWVLESVVTGQAASSVLAGTTIPLTFEPGSTRIAGTAGCNRYMGDVDAGEGRFTAGALGATKMACAAEIMNQEQTFLAALQAARSYEIRDGRLVLSDGSGQALLIFTAPK